MALQPFEWTYREPMAAGGAVIAVTGLLQEILPYPSRQAAGGGPSGAARFVARELYPDVDFYSGLIYKAMGFPPRR
jgi:hypothetical protein